MLPRPSRILAVILLAMLAWTMDLGTATAQDGVRARGWTHQDFGRLVLDWPAPVGFQSARDGNTLTLRFDRPLTAELTRALGFLPSYLVAGQVGADGRSVVLTLAGDFAVNAFANGSSVVVDFRQGGPEQQQAQTPAPAPAPAAQTPPAAAQVPPAPERPAPVPVPAAPPVAAAPPAPAPPAPAAAGTAATPSAPARAPAVPPEPQPAAPRPPTAEQVADRVAADALAALRGEQSADGPGSIDEETLRNAEAAVDLVTFTFEWPDMVGAAVFPRGDFIFVVFDRRETVDLAPFRQAGQQLVDRIEQLPVSNATVIRLRPKRGLSPSARREGFNWAVGLRAAPVRAESQVEIAVGNADTGGQQLLLKAAAPGGAVTITDPEVGDQLQIGTMQDSGLGMRGSRHYPDATLLATAQGVAVETLSDGVELERSFDGFALHRPEGLSLTGIAPDAPVSLGAALSGRQLFDFPGWAMRGAGFEEEDEAILLQAATTAPQDAKTEPRLALARFYAAQGRWPESLGVLRVLSADPALAERPDFRALRGAVNLLAGRLPEARADLADTRLDGFQEAALWRGALLSAEANWREANLQFGPADSLLKSYPYPLKAKLGLLRIESALQASDIRVGGEWIDELNRDAEKLSRSDFADLRYQQARVEVTRNNADGAQEIWQELAAGPDERNAVRAEFSLINTGLTGQEITPEQAIERLNKLRYNWRGDRFELVVLRTLARLHLQIGDFLEALRNLRAAVSYFPDDPLAAQIAAQMSDIFRQLYLDGEADKLQPLRALAIFDEFRELTPTGPDGDRMIELLADRLVGVDLLDRAAAQLEHQIEFRLQGPERARVGTKLALIYLMDRKPEQALTALSESSVPGIPRELEDDRRRLEAKAQYDLGRSEEAISLLAGDISREADMLRRDFFWDEKNWGEAAKVLQRLTGDPPRGGGLLPEDRARHALNWAVALQLSNDRSGLTLLRDLYLDSMKGGPMGEMFDYITAPAARDRPADLQAAVDRLSRDSQFEGFMRNYQDKLKAPPADAGPPSVSVSAAAAARAG